MAFFNLLFTDDKDYESGKSKTDQTFDLENCKENNSLKSMV